ncbi:retrovirus-related pol polyprotein from transposon TNT 1-94 [Tanacetum coccineum]
MAKRAQPALYDADTLLLHHHPVSIWDSGRFLVHQLLHEKDDEKPGMHIGLHAMNVLVITQYLDRSACTEPLMEPAKKIWNGRFLRTKDETPQVIEKFIVKTQRALNATVHFVRTDNGTEFVNKTLDGWFESVGISHETSVPRSPQLERGARSPNLQYFSECLDLCASYQWDYDDVVNSRRKQNANGSPSTTVILEGGPAVTESLLPHQIPLPDTSDSDDETLFDHVDSNVFDTHNAPETDSEASHSNSVNIDVTPNNPITYTYKQALEHSCWIEAMQEEIHEFERLDDAIWTDVLKNKARLGRKVIVRSGIDFVESICSGFQIRARSGLYFIAHAAKGFVDPEHPSHVYRLKKALYGLKQAPRAWYDKLSAFLIKSGFTKGVMSRMDKCHSFLGLQISQNPRGIFINQSKYAQEFLKKFGFDSCTPIDTPMAERPNLDEDKGGKLIDPTRFRGMVGSLMYLSASRPDIVFAVCMCARYQAKPTEMHLTAIKRIFRCHEHTDRMLCSNPLDAVLELRRLCICSVQQKIARLLKEVVELYFVETKYQLADIFTKALPRERFATLLPLLGVKQMSPETLKELQDESVSGSKGRTVADSIAAD